MADNDPYRTLLRKLGTADKALSDAQQAIGSAFGAEGVPEKTNNKLSLMWNELENLRQRVKGILR